MSFDGKAFGQEIVAATKLHIDKTVAPLLKQIEALQADRDVLRAEIEVLKAIPAPKDGKDGAPGAKGDAGEPGQAGRDGAQGQDGRSGASVAGAMIDRKGALILTLSDGSTCHLGRVVGKDADPELIKQMVTEALMALPPAQNGKDADPALVAALVEETVVRAVAALPAAKDGKDGEAGLPGADGAAGRDGRDGTDGKDGAPGLDGKDGAAGLNGKDGAEGRDGINGKDGHSVTLDDVRPLIEEMVTKAVTLIPVPKDGRDGIDGKDGAPGLNGKDGASGIDGKDGANGLNGKDGRDGLDVKDLFVIEGGELVATFTDGRMKNLGPFRGADGVNGADGEDGINGVNGIDGKGIDDITEEIEDEGRFIVLRFFHAGEEIKQLRIQTKTALYRGVHDKEHTYLPGDMVSWGGSQWHCKNEATGLITSENWQLAVKKGRDGKD